MLKFSIYDQLSRRILVLDGGLGTMIQGYGLGEEDYRGERFAGSEVLLKGCNDLLVLTKPEAIRSIHEAYLQAGADIISTDSFNANAVSMADYALQEYVYEINRAAAALARSEADRFTLRNPSKPRFVAGSMGPTNRTASISPDVNDPGYRAVTFDELAEAYYEQARGLVDGGADVLLVETVFDTLNAKAALFAIERLRAERGVPIPVMVSGTITDASGRTLSGQTIRCSLTWPGSPPWPNAPCRRIRMPGSRTASAATTRRRNGWPRRSTAICGRDCSISSGGAAARRPSISPRSPAWRTAALRERSPLRRM